MIDKLPKLHKYVRLINIWKVLVCNDNIAHSPNIWSFLPTFRFLGSHIPTYKDIDVKTLSTKTNFKSYRHRILVELVVP